MKQALGIQNHFGKTQRIVVGIVDGATVPELDISVLATTPKKYHAYFKEHGGSPFPSEYITKAKKELDNFVAVLEDHGIAVDRPKEIDFSAPIITPEWKTKSGLYAAMPRDILLVVGNKIIVAPMSWRCRYHEANAYTELLENYKTEGYEVIYAPKPKLSDDLYNPNSLHEEPFISILNETEPVFDAADFLVLGDLVIGQKSHVTNQAGIDWLRNTLGPKYTLCIIETKDDKPMHIDATITPLREGLMLINPERVAIESLRKQLPSQLKEWEFLPAPQPVVLESDPPKYFTSDWVSMNIITLDSNTAIVEKDQKPLKKLLEEYGFSVIEVPFKYFQCFGGSFHCATQEIARDK